MSFQNLIDNAAKISWSTSTVSGQSISRSGIVKSSSIVTRQPWIITIEMSPGLRYTDPGVREMLSELDYASVNATEYFNIGSNNPGLSWLTEYAGDLTPSQVAQLNITTESNTETSILQVGVENVTGTTAGTIMFRAGDFIQPGGNYPFVYRVVSDVATPVINNNVNEYVEVPVHRRIIPVAGYDWFTGSNGVRVGPQCVYQMKLLTTAQYSITPDRIVEWSGPLTFIESFY